MIMFIKTLDGQAVAKSSLTYKNEGDYISFTSFGSDPPFAGLGSRVLGRLDQLNTEGLPIAPSGPVVGAYAFYAKKFNGFKIDQSVYSAIARHLSEYDLAALKQNLENPGTRATLTEAQEGVKRIEGGAILRGTMSYGR
jgi:hypothetical protein